MTILEFFKTATIEEIAERFAQEVFDSEKYGIVCSNPWSAFDLDDHFARENACPEECEHLCEKNYGERKWLHECQLALSKIDECPYNMDVHDVMKERFLEWLNMDLEE